MANQDRCSIRPVNDLDSFARRPPRSFFPVRRVGAFTLAVLAGVLAVSLPAEGAARATSATFTSRVFATGNHILHATDKGKVAVSEPDDITYLNGRIYVGFQNGVGPQGQAGATGNVDSTVVAFSTAGKELAQWDVHGHCDGLTADPLIDRVITTVNEDANSSIYLIDPAGAAVHYSYNVLLPSHGGTDAIEIYRGMVLISASAPGTTGKPAPQPNYPAVYRATFDSATRIATMRALFFDESEATVANTNSPGYGHRVRLALTDPDSNEDVPIFARRFAGDFMLTSQGDEEQIFVSGAGTRHQRLSVLKLTGSVDDSAWPSDATGAIYTTDNSDNTVYRIAGPFQRGEVFAADTPCDENSAPSTCPAPGYPPNHLVMSNPDTGVLTRVVLHGPKPAAQGMLFLP